MIARMIIVTVPVKKIHEAEHLWKTECAPLMIQQDGCESEEFLRNVKTGELISLQKWETWRQSKNIGPAPRTNIF